MMSARDDVLARIRTALGDGVAEGGGLADARVGPPDPTRGELSSAGLITLLAQRLGDYGSNVRRCAADQVPATIAAALAERGAGRLVVPAGFDHELLPEGVSVVVDDGLTADALDAVDGVVTGAAVAIAETGTIVLDGSAGQGRRALTLVPDYHLCLLRVDQVVSSVPAAIAMVSPDGPLTWISGPSATSDIELDRVQGVHGPRTLEVIIIGS